LQVTPIPVLYILLGSRRGAQMMQRHWATHAQGAARAMGAFLPLDPRNAEMASAVPRSLSPTRSRARADGIVAETNAIFDLFDPQPESFRKKVATPESPPDDRTDFFDLGDPHARRRADHDEFVGRAEGRITKTGDHHH
ncbi:hypothetical protein KTN05_17300, partial [Paracoccus sp. Z118]|uniref:hypothetical protein n=1 Tax=Paracoccus sp. Z118 TaxID=2851017 RepID=UPI001C2C3CEC